MYFNCGTQTFEMAFKQNLKDNPNHVIHCIDKYCYLYLHKIFSYLHNRKSILRRLPLLYRLREFFYQRCRIKSAVSRNNVKFQAFNSTFHHEGAKRNKRNNEITKPTKSTNIFLNENKINNATTSM